MNDYRHARVRNAVRSRCPGRTGLNQVLEIWGCVCVCVRSVYPGDVSCFIGLENEIAFPGKILLHVSIIEKRTNVRNRNRPRVIIFGKCWQQQQPTYLRRVCVYVWTSMSVRDWHNIEHFEVWTTFINFILWKKITLSKQTSANIPKETFLSNLPRQLHLTTMPLLAIAHSLVSPVTFSGLRTAQVAARIQTSHKALITAINSGRSEGPRGTPHYKSEGRFYLSDFSYRDVWNEIRLRGMLSVWFLKFIVNPNSSLQFCSYFSRFSFFNFFYLHENLSMHSLCKKTILHHVFFIQVSINCNCMKFCILISNWFGIFGKGLIKTVWKKKYMKFFLWLFIH